MKKKKTFFVSNLCHIEKKEVKKSRGFCVRIECVTVENFQKEGRHIHIIILLSRERTFLFYFDFDNARDTEIMPKHNIYTHEPSPPPTTPNLLT